MTAPAFAEGHRGALLIGTGSYDHPGLPALLSPAVDCDRLAEVLDDKEIGGFEVQKLVDADQSTLTRAMEEFFGRQAGRDDVRLLYLSCHGILNRNDKLHFAVRTTDLEWPASTAIPASFVRDLMEDCRARSIVVVLDCCYSGRFLPGAKGGGGPAGFEKALAGHGRVVITAGSGSQRAWEGDHPDPSRPAPSRFTGALVDGLRTGAADLNGDGVITVQELYTYAYERLQQEGADQNPRMGTEEMQYDLALARVKPKPKKRRPKRTPRPAPAPGRADLPWRTGAASGPAQQPVLSDGVLVVRERCFLHVRDAGTRTRHPRIEMPYPGRPALHGGVAYFPGKGGWLQAVDLRTGRPRRCRRLTVGDGLLGISGDVLYAPSPNGHLHALDPVTGEDLWRPLPLPGLTVTAAPETAAGHVLLMAGDSAHHVMAVDAATGRVSWSYRAEGRLSPEWAVTDQGIHLVQRTGAAAGRIVTLDPATGKTLWPYETAAPLAAAPVAADGLVVFGDVDNRLVALDASTGDKRWEKKTRGRLLTRPAAMDGTLHTADRAAQLTARRLRDGRQLRSHDVLLSQDREGHPAVAENALYLTDSHGDLHALPTP